MDVLAGWGEEKRGIAVRDFLESELMQGSLLVGGAGGLNRIMVRTNIYADEEILDWVKPGELLFLTEKNCEHWEDGDWQLFLERCAELGLAGLALKYNEEKPQIPTVVADRAERLQLPVLLLPCTLAVAEAGSAAFELIFARQREILQQQRELSEALQRCLLEHQDTRNVLLVLEQNLGLPCCFVNHDSQESVFSLEGAEAGELQEYLLKDVERVLLEEDRGLRPRLCACRLGPEPAWRVVVPVASKEQVYGSLFAWSYVELRDSFVPAAMETVAATLALLTMQDYALRLVEMKHSSELIEELISTPNEHVLDRAAVYKLNSRFEHGVLLIRLIFCEEEAKRLPRDSRSFFCSNLHWIQSCLKQHQLRGLLAYRGNCLEAVLERTGQEEAEQVHKRIVAFCGDLERSFSNRFGQLRMQAGVSRFYPGFSELDKSYHEAENTVQLGEKLLGRPVLFFTELGIFRILIQKSVSDEMEVFFHETLDPLLAYDRKKCTELVPTLEAYFRNNANINKTSEEMFTHYNTVLYRLERIREISGRDLSDPHERLNFEIALKVRKIYQNR